MNNVIEREQRLLRNFHSPGYYCSRWQHCQNDWSDVSDYHIGGFKNRRTVSETPQKKDSAQRESKNPSIYNIIYWVAWTIGQRNCRPSIWCSKYYFFFMISCKILYKNPFNLFSYLFHKITKIKSFECPKFYKKFFKKILGHQTLGRWFICPIVKAIQRNIL